MITVAIPGQEVLLIERVVLDVNGTLTLDGALIGGVAERIARLQERATVELLTADTRNRLDDIARLLQVRGVRLAGEAIGDQKRAYVERLGPARVAAIGNGMNDRGMLAAAALSIAVIGPEGAARAALGVADVVVASITDALELLLDPLRLVATLRP
jgi:soluble P-type ATPase